MSAISVRLGHLRAARGLTQQQLADATGLRRDTISALERGKSQAIEFATLARLCDALGVGASEILAVAPTAHAAPVLGGEDEDAIIAERRAEEQDEIAALIADPRLAVLALEGEFALPAAKQEMRELNQADVALLNEAISAAYDRVLTSAGPERRQPVSLGRLEQVIAELRFGDPEIADRLAAMLFVFWQQAMGVSTEHREEAAPSLPRSRVG